MKYAYSIYATTIKSSCLYIDNCLSIVNIVIDNMTILSMLDVVGKVVAYICNRLYANFVVTYRPLELILFEESLAWGPSLGKSWLSSNPVCSECLLAKGTTLAV